MSAESAWRRWPSAWLWFLVAYGVVMPHFNGGTNQAGIFYGELGDSPGDLVRTTLTNPTLVIDRLHDNDALGYARDLLAPFGFLPVLAPALLAVAAPQFFANILTNANFFYDIRFHYTAIILAMLALATVEGVAWLRLAGTAPLRRRPRRRVGAGDVGGMGHLAAQHRLPDRLLAARTATPARTCSTTPSPACPDDAAVAATYYIVPHLSHRDQIYTFPNPWIPANWGVAGVAPTIPTATTRRRRSSGSSSTAPPTAPGRGRSSCSTSCSTDGEFEVVSDREGIVVARRVAPPRRATSHLVERDYVDHRRLDRAQMAGGDRPRPDRRGHVGRVVRPAGGGRWPARPGHR